METELNLDSKNLESSFHDAKTDDDRHQNQLANQTPADPIPGTKAYTNITAATD